ncbi:hypothetical protein PVAP13_4KG108315 [Panicum virgatum]|uniref:Uncharacterized protein n=1 Tax=Panicum virgatum TaxID=38727 RepID=A0A8T0TIH8_PANVG|nr:hypothetical protein PVAP13_4KG108315 [Panicum virgatum]
MPCSLLESRWKMIVLHGLGLVLNKAMAKPASPSGYYRKRSWQRQRCGSCSRRRQCGSGKLLRRSPGRGRRRRLRGKRRMTLAPLRRRASPPVHEATAPCGPASSAPHLLADGPTSSAPPCGPGSSAPLLLVDAPGSVRILCWSVALCGSLQDCNGQKFISSLPSPLLRCWCLLSAAGACFASCGCSAFCL